MATRTWSITASGTYDINNPANWLYGVTPDFLDVLQFGTGATDTITGNATVAEILVTQGTFSLAGNYLISGLQSTELSITGSSAPSSLTILPGALINGGQAVTLTGGFASLFVQGGLVASSLAINGSVLRIAPGADFDITGPITMTANSWLVGGPAVNQSAGPAIVIGNAIAITGATLLGSNGGQETDFNGVISGAGSVDVVGDGQADIVAFNGNNSYSNGVGIGAANLIVEAGSATAFGTGQISFSAGEILGTATETIGNSLAMGGNVAVAAAHGQTLTIGTGFWSYSPTSNSQISFGSPGQDGTVVFKDTAGASIVSGVYSVAVQAGTLKAGDGAVGFLMNQSSAQIVQSGATLDIAGQAVTLTALSGGGRITDSGAQNGLTITNTVGSAGFSGLIDGASAVVVNGAVVLTGSDVATGGTTILASDTLTLGNGGASGSVTGSVTDNGALAINRSDFYTLNNVSGSGRVVQSGPGATILGSGLAYTGGTTINSGVLSVGAGALPGSGTLTIAGGEFLASSTETVANQLAMSGNFTIAAAHNQTLTISNATPWSLTAGVGEQISIGAAGQDGVVVLKAAPGSTIVSPGNETITLQAGTLRAGDGTGVGFLLGADLATVVQAGATLDAAGFAIAAGGLEGSGHVGDSGGAANLTIINGNFSGLIDGALSVTIYGSVTLTGAETYTGGTTITGGAELSLGGGGGAGSITGNIVDNGVLEFRLSSVLVENGVISGTGQVVQDGSGTTVLSQINSFSGGIYLNGGTLELQQQGSAGGGNIFFFPGSPTTLQIDSASMPTNQIIGLAAGDTVDLRAVSANGWSVNGSTFTLLQGATSVAQLTLTVPISHPVFGVAPDGFGGVMIHLEPTRGEFTGNGFSGLLYQNGDGTPAIWEVNGSSILASALFANPGTSWRLVGTGDFNGDGKSDFLWQHASGIPAAWEMNGTSIIAGVSFADPGASWKLVGSGDFNGDGFSDLLFQNSDGAPAIWETQNGSVIGSGGLSNPGASWRLVGTGDFNGDGKSDLVFQNSDGTPAIWEMNGTSLLAAAGLSNPGSGWKLVDTGDFNGDGKSDLVFQNSDGTPAIWLMNGTNLIGAAGLSNPGSSWTLIGTGDFNGDGKSDLLFQGSGGTPAIWEMNGTSIFANVGLSNPGAAWHLIPLL